MNLVNKHNDQKSSDYIKLCFDQYKHFVDSAEKVSERRLKANVFFISIQSLLISLIGLFNVDKDISHNSLIVLAILGCLISIVWWVYINSFKQLNKLKFKVIHEMESFVPFRSYSYEWFLDKNKAEKYIRLSAVEKVVPFFFIGLYLLLVILVFAEIL